MTLAKQESVERSKPEDVVKRFYAVYNRHDLDAVVAMVDPNYVLYSPLSPEPVKGRDALRKYLEPVLKPFPDFGGKILNIMAKGDTVAVEGMSTGTFKGPIELGGRTIPPTGSRVEFKYAEFYLVNSKGLIAEERAYYDAAGLFRRLGIKA